MTDDLILQTLNRASVGTILQITAVYNGEHGLNTIIYEGRVKTREWFSTEVGWQSGKSVMVIFEDGRLIRQWAIDGKDYWSVWSTDKSSRYNITNVNIVE